MYWYIQCLAPYYGVNTDTAEFIAKHESQFVWDQKGDYSTSTGRYTSYGIYQLHLPAHPDITVREATDPVFNVTWSLIQMSIGNLNIWSSWKFRNLWYSNG